VLIKVRSTSVASQPAGALTRRALVELSQRYGGDGDATPVTAEQFTPPAGDFFVAYVNGRPAGCGGWRTLAPAAALTAVGERDEPTAEVKRMFVAPAYRGRGIAVTILRTIEYSAQVAGKRHLVLETGDRQPEAIALYQKAGYTRVPDFGHYRNEPGVVSFGRRIARARAVDPDTRVAYWARSRRR